MNSNRLKKGIVIDYMGIKSHCQIEIMLSGFNDEKKRKVKLF